MNRMKVFLLRVIANALALGVAAWLIPGIHIGTGATDQLTEYGSVNTILAYLFIGLIFGLVNAIVRPIVSLLALPITCLTLGLFAVVINAGMLMLTSWLSSFTPIPFHVETFFWDAILGAIIISIVSALIGLITPKSRT
nr:phage holin family protein [Paeniglutamicibacter cryotolerans]